MTYLKEIFRRPSTYVLLLISLFSIALSVLRVLYTEKSMFTFMIWNLFLAFLPWFVISIVSVYRLKNKLILMLALLIWVAFFPNAPYVLTDLLHLGKEGSAPEWFDLILLLSYGFAGMMYGFSGLFMLEEILGRSAGKRTIHAVIVGLIYVSSFGIYLGRFLRWNSWDLLTNLGVLTQDVFDRLTDPFSHPTTWVFTLLFGTLLNLIYYGFRFIARPSAKEAP